MTIKILIFAEILRKMQLIKKYFPQLTALQLTQFEQLEELYKDWNLKINVVSRKDIDQLYLRHVLHSLAIAKLISFRSDARVMDVGTGGGFPGIPLAIMFPETKFHLVDSIAKKLKVVNEVVEGLGLTNVTTIHGRVEDLTDTYDFIVSRAVAAMPTFVYWVRGRIAKTQRHGIKNGILYLKGGDLSEELRDFPKATVYALSDFYEEEFFETKKLVHLPLKHKG